MIFGMGIIFTSFLYLLIITIIYIPKKKIHTDETRIYNILLLLSIINCIIEFTLCVSILLKVELYSFYYLFVNKLFLATLFSWFTIFSYYMFTLASLDNIKLKNFFEKKYGNNYSITIIKKTLPLVMFIMTAILLLPITIYSDGTYAYSTGISVKVLETYCGISTGLWVLFTILGMNKTNYKKYIPCLGFIICFIGILIGRKIFPGLILNSFSAALPTFLMYHTIENPDVRYITELSKLKNAIEKANNNKNDFLYRIVQKFKDSIKTVIRIGEQSLNENEMITKNEGISIMIEETKKAETFMNEVLDISPIDEKNLKQFKNKYNIKNLYKEIILKVNNELNNNNKIKFRTNIADDIPTELYGDSIKIKQILYTLLNNSIKQTENGFIELRIDAIVKYDVCRLVFNIEDSGNGIEAEKLSHIFEPVDNHDTSIVNNDMNLNLPTIKKMIDYIGGTIIINSQNNKGTQITIILNQRIEKTNLVDKNIDKFIKTEEKLKTNNILLIDNNDNYVKDISKYLSSYNIVYEENGQLGLTRIRNKENYNFIIISEDLNKLSTSDTIKRLREENYSNPIFILGNKKNSIELIKIGATDVINVPLNINEIKLLLEKYL